MNWIIITSEDDVFGNKIRIFGKRNQHIQTVLKKNVSEKIRVIHPGVQKGIFEITNICPEFVEVTPFELEHDLGFRGFSKTEIFFALPRPQTGKKILHLCGLYGIGTINFIFPEHKNKEYLTSPLYLGGELSEIYDGMSQSGNPFTTEVLYTKSNSLFLDSIHQEDTVILDPSGISYTKFASEIKDSFERRVERKFVFGPESGFTPDQLQIFKDKNIKIANLGNVILRTEYAFHAFLHQTQLLLEANSA